MAADLVKIVVIGPFDGEGRHGRSRGARESVGHGVGHDLVITPMADQDRAAHATDLAKALEPVPQQQADRCERELPLRHLGEAGEGGEDDERGGVLARSEVDRHGAPERAADRDNQRGIDVGPRPQVFISRVGRLVTP